MTTTELTLEERLDVAEAAARDFRSRMKAAEAQRDTTQRSHDWWIRFVGRPREAEFNRLRDIEIAARRFMGLTHGDGREKRELEQALAVPPVAQPDEAQMAYAQKLEEEL